MKYCKSCILPDTRPGIEIAEDGICNACKQHKKKPDLNWSERESQFKAVVADAKSKTSAYDCLVPVSGGKDSTWQVVKCLEYGLTPLAVTWRPPGRTDIGQRNLDNLIHLGVDHIDYSVNPQLEKRFMLKTFEKCGSIAIPMHLGIFNIPLNLALKFNIPLVVWGENSAIEYGGNNEHAMGFKLNAEWLKQYSVTQGTTAEDWVTEGFSQRELTPYFGPTEAELDKAGILAVFLGWYFNWDPESSQRVASENGFEFHSDGARTGYYDFADIDDDFISLHHWLKWYKFGITRTWDNLSLEIRNGRMSRDEALKIIRNRGHERPHQDIERFCQYTGIDEARFEATCETFRNPDIWERRKGRWEMPEFLIEGWDWSNE